MKTHKPKILIVDDEEGFTKLTKLTLTDYEILEENNSGRALQTARSFEPDLILLDVMMPDFDDDNEIARTKTPAGGCFIDAQGPRRDGELSA
ncbi:MAG: response regulator, partial [Chthoniobacterales bacterium]